MTEAEWQSCTEPGPMLQFLRGRASARKLRLFACALYRYGAPYRLRALPPHTVAPFERALAEAEQLADGEGVSSGYDGSGWAVHEEDPAEAAEIALLDHGPKLASLPLAAQAALLRDVFGNPFRPVVLAPSCRTPDVMSLAEAAYQERALPAGTLEPARLALLADALEDAGCTSPEVLGHLRGAGPHVRGCWALDRLLGRE